MKFNYIKKNKEEELKGSSWRHLINFFVTDYYCIVLRPKLKISCSEYAIYILISNVSAFSVTHKKRQIINRKLLHIKIKNTKFAYMIKWNKITVRSLNFINPSALYLILIYFFLIS